MSVTATHPQYDQWAETWRCYRDSYTGSSAVKGSIAGSTSSRDRSAAGSRYLSTPAGMRTPQQFASYRDRPAWVGATESAVHGISGAVFRHEPHIEAPTSIEPHLADITQTGVSLRMFAEQTVRETLLMGRFGLLVDFPAPAACCTCGTYRIIWEMG